MSSTVDDTDTQYIQYTGSGWSQQDPTNPSWNANFFNSTYRFTGGEGDTLELAFKGTGIEYFAATRNNHGLHSVYLDDNPDRTLINTYSAGDAFNVSIYAAKDLKDGIHSVKIVNEPKMTNIAGRVGLGLDWIVIQGTPIEWRSAAVAVISAQSSSSSLVSSSYTSTSTLSTVTTAVGLAASLTSSAIIDSSVSPASPTLTISPSPIVPDTGGVDAANNPNMVYTAFNAPSSSFIRSFGAQSNAPHISQVLYLQVVAMLICSPSSTASHAQTTAALPTSVPLIWCCIFVMALIGRLLPCWH